MTAFHQPGDLYDLSLSGNTEVTMRERETLYSLSLFSPVLSSPNFLYFPSESCKAFCSLPCTALHCTDLCLTASSTAVRHHVCLCSAEWRIVFHREIIAADWPDIHQLKIIVWVESDELSIVIYMCWLFILDQAQLSGKQGDYGGTLDCGRGRAARCQWTLDSKQIFSISWLFCCEGEERRGYLTKCIEIISGH